MKRRLFIRVHAARRMMERGISMEEVEHVIEGGEVIEQYLDDEPFPSRLILGSPSGSALHVVAANEIDTDITHVITAYRPNPDKWEDGFRRRKK
jgi:hypothetical protein